MKEFVVYTGLRLVLFLATWAVVLGAWVLISGDAPIFVTVLIAFALSGVGAYFVLNGPRSRFANRVETRAERMVANFDNARAREDVDEQS